MSEFLECVLWQLQNSLILVVLASIIAVAVVAIAEFSEYDSIPRGMLVSNEGAYEVYINLSNPDVVLVATQWHTAPVGENGETSHSGFDVYIRYDCPFT